MLVVVVELNVAAAERLAAEWAAAASLRLATWLNEVESGEWRKRSRFLR